VSYAVIASLIAFLIGVLPAARILADTLGVYAHILGHTGSNGGGAAGLLSLSILADHFRALLVPGTGLLVAMPICCLMLVFGRSRDGNFNRLFLLSALTMLLQYILVMKNPGERYLEPAYAVTALVYPALLFLTSAQAAPKRYIARFAVVAIMALVGLSAARAAAAWFSEAATVNRDNEKLLAVARASGCTIVPYYDAPEPEYRLMFGNETSGLRHSDTLSRRYPEFLSYNIWREQFQTFTDVQDTAQALKILHRQKCVYLFGSSMDRMANNNISAYDIKLSS
jgi:hypothetical protein